MARSNQFDPKEMQKPVDFQINDLVAPVSYLCLFLSTVDGFDYKKFNQALDFRLYELKNGSQFIIIIPTNKELTDKNQKENMLSSLNIKYFDDNQYITKVNIASNDRIQYGNDIPLMNSTKPLFDIDTITSTPIINKEKTLEALKLVIESKKFQTALQKKKSREEILTSLATEQYNGTYDNQLVYDSLQILKDLRPKINQEYKTVYQQVQKSSKIRSQAKNFGEYLSTYKILSGRNLSDILLDNCGDFTPNSKISLELVTQHISESFSTAVIDREGSDVDNLVLFNPLTGCWEHNDNTFNRLIVALRPTSSEGDFKRVKLTLAAQAANRNEFIKPYSASRHLLCSNHVWDLKTNQYLPLNSDEVKDLHFTERSKLNIEHDPNVKIGPKLKDMLKGGGDWDIQKFISAYGYNDPEKTQFFLFILSLGLFGGHNFGIHVSIKGSAGWGKSSLKIIFDNLYNRNTIRLPWRELNKPFPFTDYKQSNSLIWIDECNTDTPPLDNESGIINYDSLANAEVVFNNKGKANIVIENPPQVYIDGTAYAKAVDMSTGPLRRTMVYQLPENTDLRNQIQATNINQALSNTRVLQYLLNAMAYAYTHTLKFPDNRKDELWNLQLNLSEHDRDLNLLPSFEQDWRRDFMQQQGQLQDWFEEEFIRFVNADVTSPTDPNATIMNDDVAYTFYVASYEDKYSTQDRNSRNRLQKTSFITQFNSLLSTYGWEKIPYGSDGIVIESLHETNYDIEGYDAEGLITPMVYTDKYLNADNATHHYPLKTRSKGWYKLIKTDQP